MPPTKTLAQAQHVLSHYPLGIRPLEPLGGAGGFSGAEFWRVHGLDGDWCLRCWPLGHPSPERLKFIHAVLGSVARRGLEVVAVPEPTRQGETFIVSAGHHWELARWMPGSPARRNSLNREQLGAAMRCLGTFHLLAADCQQTIGAAPGIVERVDRITELERGVLQKIQEACRQPVWPELASRVDPILRSFQLHAPRLKQQLVAAGKLHVPVQPCIRDIWSDHVLFTGNDVSGLIDFGAMRMDHVAADVARLVGSLVGDDEELRRVALSTYAHTRVLSEQELLLVNIYDRSSTVLSGMNWLQWICLERRHFPSREHVLARLDEILQRLASLADS